MKGKTMKTLLTSLTILLASLFALNANAQHSLTVEVTNLELSKGRLMIAVSDSEENFMTSNANGQMIDIVGSTTKIKFENLPTGNYAVIFYQDENNNYNLDLGEMGIPTEKYGFSNEVDPAVLRRKPTFDECKFSIDNDTTITIEARRALTKEK